MAYKYSTGSVRRGDIYFEDDRAGDATYIDFGQDTITLRPSGSQILYTEATKVGINTTAPDYTLDVAGDVGVNEYIYHNGDSDTFIRFQDDDIVLKAGNVNFIKLTEDDSQDKLICNEGRADLDFIVRSPNESLALYLNADNEVFHVNHGESAFKTKIHSTNGEAITVNEFGVILNEDGAGANDFRVETTGSTHTLFIDGGTDKVGIGTSAPKVKLDVLHDPTSLVEDTGGGEVVTFGGEDGSDTLAAGKLMFLHTSGDWKYADADAVATSGPVLLGIALGTAVADGILLRGYYNFAAGDVQGTFVNGATCYVSENAGDIDFTAPTGAGDIVRVIGWGTDTARVIYFNPSGDWVEIAS